MKITKTIFGLVDLTKDLLNLLKTARVNGHLSYLVVKMDCLIIPLDQLLKTAKEFYGSGHVTAELPERKRIIFKL